MAIEAIAWVLSQDIRPSTAKFVLVGFCNYLQPNSTAWCAISTLSEITSQDVKTVRRGIRTLEELGHIHDTGKKAGQTGQITLYQVRLPDAVFLKISKGTALGRKGYQKRSSNPTQNGTRSFNDPLLTMQQEEKRHNRVVPIGELAKLKEVLKKN